MRRVRSSSIWRSSCVSVDPLLFLCLFGGVGPGLFRTAWLAVLLAFGLLFSSAMSGALGGDGRPPLAGLVGFHRLGRFHRCRATWLA
jgi:hypothetical protein